MVIHCMHVPLRPAPNLVLLHINNPPDISLLHIFRLRLGILLVAMLKV